MRRRSFLTRAGSTLCLLPLRVEVSPSVSKFGMESGPAIALAGDCFQLGEQEYQLADIIAPSAFSLGQGNENITTPYFEKAKDALQLLLERGNFSFQEVLPVTRWGAKRVHVYDAIAKPEASLPSVQEMLVKSGAARVAPQSDTASFIEALLVRERLARSAKQGLWELEPYGVVDALAADEAIGNYHLVSGRVRAVKNTRSRTYLNFGDDYRTDFTVTVESTRRREWAAASFDMAELKGARIRVRGFVLSINGPSIELQHRQQIEILS